MTGCTGGGDSNSTTADVKQTYPAKTLPAKFIVATAPTSGNYARAKERLDFVRRVAEKCKVRGIQGVNLFVDWRDLESQQGVIDFELLDNMIIEIKSRGLFCILRVYVNFEENWQVWPSWISPILTYISTGGNVTNILPWDTAYQAAFESLQSKLSNHFTSTQIQPDAVQITVGGSYGEQVLAGYDSQAAGWDGVEFFNQLMQAELQHVDMYTKTLGTLPIGHILMVNSLMPGNTAREDEVGQYARNKGVSWIESNAGACFLIGKSYGPDNARMLGRFKSGGAKIFLEDESGNWSCPMVSQDASLSHRVELMRQLNSTYGFTFDAVSINGWNSDLDDTDGIAALKQLLGL